MAVKESFRQAAKRIYHDRDFEYPRDTPDGEQMDFGEVMEIADGLIRRHCAYWGWRGVKVIQDDAYHK